MSLTIRSTLALLTLGALSISTARAQQPHASSSSTPADSASAACVQAYEQAQEQRHSGSLLAARARLQSCAREECPEFIRNDCAAWYDALQAEMPSVVFAARSAGRDLSDVRVSLGKRVLTSRIDGEAIELDPGEYDFDFAAPGMQPLTEHVLISRGERNRLQRVELVPSVAGADAVGKPVSLPAPAQRSWLAPAVFGGVALVGLSSFGVLAAWGHSAESTLDATCAPHCSEDQISSVRTKYVAADVSLAVGVASLGLATYLALRSGPEQRVAHILPFDVRASAQGLSASYQEAF